MELHTRYTIYLFDNLSYKALTIRNICIVSFFCSALYAKYSVLCCAYIILCKVSARGGGYEGGKSAAEEGGVRRVGH